MGLSPGRAGPFRTPAPPAAEGRGPRGSGAAADRLDPQHPGSRGAADPAGDRGLLAPSPDGGGSGWGRGGRLGLVPHVSRAGPWEPSARSRVLRRALPPHQDVVSHPFGPWADAFLSWSEQSLTFLVLLSACPAILS